jgi:hypothetical protein
LGNLGYSYDNCAKELKRRMQFETFETLSNSAHVPSSWKFKQTHCCYAGGQGSYTYHNFLHFITVKILNSTDVEAGANVR